MLIYHFFVDFMPGGFLGVDVFFTFSGYLITALMIEEYRKKSEFALVAFYKRRFLRIFPSLFLMLMAMLPLALLISPDFTVAIDRQTTAALGFVTNYYEIQTGGSYEAQLFPHLFVHTWSLAVEVQIYLVWGAVCAAIARLLNTRYKNAPAVRVQLLKEWLFVVAMLLAVLSYLNMRFLYAQSPADPSAAYFAATSHAFPFLIGAAAATVLGLNIKTQFRRQPTFQLALGALILSITGIFVLAFTNKFTGAATYHFACLATALLCVVAIWSARILHELTPKQLQEPRALSLSSDLSYCIYLFHWPFYIIVSQLVVNPWLAMLVTMLFTLPLSAWVYALTERTPRGRVLPTVRTQTARAAMAAATLACVAFSGVVIYRAPVISSVERDLNISYLYEDAQAIRDFANGYIALASPPEAAPTPAPTKIQLPDLPQNFSGGVYIIGDSVCLGAARELRKRIPDCMVDALGSRSIADGYRGLMKMQKMDLLKEEYIVVALGANVTSDARKRVDQIISDLSAGRRIIFVTPYNGRLDDTSQTAKIARYMRTLPEKHPFVTVADWAAAISEHKNWIASDKLHITGNTNALKLYVTTIMQGISEASEKPAKT